MSNLERIIRRRMISAGEKYQDAKRYVLDNEWESPDATLRNARDAGISNAGMSVLEWILHTPPARVLSANPELDVDEDSDE
jgi:hypothetical protein